MWVFPFGGWIIHQFSWQHSFLFMARWDLEAWDSTIEQWCIFQDLIIKLSWWWHGRHMYLMEWIVHGFPQVSYYALRFSMHWVATTNVSMSSNKEDGESLLWGHVAWGVAILQYHHTRGSFQHRPNLCLSWDYKAGDGASLRQLQIWCHKKILSGTDPRGEVFTHGGCPIQTVPVKCNRFYMCRTPKTKSFGYPTPHNEITEMKKVYEICLIFYEVWQWIFDDVDDMMMLHEVF